jgi:hypothetical protein
MMRAFAALLGAELVAARQRLAIQANECDGSLQLVGHTANGSARTRWRARAKYRRRDDSKEDHEHKRDRSAVNHRSCLVVCDPHLRRSCGRGVAADAIVIHRKTGKAFGSPER